MESFRIVDNEDGNYRIEMFEPPSGGLMFENQLFNMTMKMLNSDILKKEPINYSKKNEQDAVEYRKKGNGLFTSKFHNADIPQAILNLYTQSIATAPNMSEELARGYGNRSALLLHLKKYEECIKDCDRSLKITNDDLLKAKLYVRRVESVRNLDMEVITKIEEAIADITKLNLNADIKDKFKDKVNSILSFIPTTNLKDNEKEKSDQQLPSFSRQTEAPCASSAISIKYHDAEGRHIVANRKIQPGEILVLEKNYCQSIDFEYKYLFCSHCMQFTWSSIPCNQCIYSIYCSEKCKLEAWENYHSFECLVLSHLYSFKCNQYPYFHSQETKDGKIMIRNITLALRLLLFSVLEFGDRNQLMNELIILAKEWGSVGPFDKSEMLSMAYKTEGLPSNADAIEAMRTKGFSVDGVFESTTYKTIYSLSNAKTSFDIDAMRPVVTIACLVTYYLAKTSNFFGNKLNNTPEEMTLNQNVKFFGSLLLRNFFIVTLNAMNLKYFEERGDFLISRYYGASLNSFCSLFNHSCNPNVISFNTKNNETLVYAKHVIEKGQQLFLSYIDDDYTSLLQSKRMEILNDYYLFECNCLACKAHWPPTLRSFKDILKSSAELQPVLKDKYAKIEKLENRVISKLKDKTISYNLTVVKELSEVMKQHAENFTVRSRDYEKFANYMKTILAGTYGIVPIIPEEF